jgi:hypothetical protein
MGVCAGAWQVCAALIKAGAKVDAVDKNGSQLRVGPGGRFASRYAVLVQATRRSRWPSSCVCARKKRRKGSKRAAALLGAAWMRLLSRARPVFPSSRTGLRCGTAGAGSLQRGPAISSRRALAQKTSSQDEIEVQQRGHVKGQSLVNIQSVEEKAIEAELDDALNTVEHLLLSDADVGMATQAPERAIGERCALCGLCCRRRFCPPDKLINIPDAWSELQDNIQKADTRILEQWNSTRRTRARPSLSALSTTAQSSAKSTTLSSLRWSIGSDCDSMALALTRCTERSQADRCAAAAEGSTIPRQNVRASAFCGPR